MCQPTSSNFETEKKTKKPQQSESSNILSINILLHFYLVWLTYMKYNTILWEVERFDLILETCQLPKKFKNCYFVVVIL